MHAALIKASKALIPASLQHQLAGNGRLRAWVRHISRTGAEADTIETYRNRAKAGLAEAQEEMKRLERRNRGEISPDPVPRSVRIETTNACNLNCPMCETNKATRVKGIMTPEMFRTVIRELKSIGVCSAKLYTIGEPLLNKHMLSFMDICREERFRANFSTNAQFPERLGEVLRKHYDFMGGVRFSIDGASKDIYEKMRVGGTLEKVFESLAIVDEINFGMRDSMLVAVNKSVLCMTNVHDIKNYFSVFGKYISPYRHVFGVINNSGQDRDFFKDDMPFTNLFYPELPCDSVFNSLGVHYDGRISLCAHRDYNGEPVVGDLTRQSLVEIYQGTEATAFRRRHLDGDVAGIKCCDGCVTCYSFVHSLVDAYIQYARFAFGDCDAHAFGEKIIDFLHGTNKAMADKSLGELNSHIGRAFALGESPR